MVVALAETKEFYTPPINQEIAEFDDTTTWLAEVLNGNMHTSFSYRLESGDLVSDRDNRSIKQTFVDGVDEARQKADSDSRYQFEHRRRLIELKEYDEMLLMATSNETTNTMIVVSDFPQELKSSNSDFGGYNVDRQQTMLRVITRDDQGVIKVTSQSLDRSDRDALEAIYARFGITPRRGELLDQRINVKVEPKFQENLPEVLTGTYDAKLQEKYGGQWYAGRNPADYRNTYDFARCQTDLIDAFNHSPRDQDARFKLAATIEARFENRNIATSQTTVSYGSRLRFISTAVEMEFCGRRALAEGKTYSGCGMTVGGMESELGQLGYGDVDKKIQAGDGFGSLEFKCKKGHKNKRPYGKLIDCCTTCGDSVKC